MVFNLRHFFLLVLVVAMALILPKYVQAAWAMAIMAITAAGLAACFPARQKRFLFYGGLLGVFIALPLTAVVVGRNYRHLPREPVVRGAEYPGQTRAPQVQRDALEFANSYAVTLGFIAGGTVGLLLSGKPKPNAT